MRGSQSKISDDWLNIRARLSRALDTDIAWAAGFIDGEGCFSVKRTKYQNRKRIAYSINIAVVQKAIYPLYKLQHVLSGVVNVNSPTTLFKWSISGVEAALVSERLAPYLALKKEEALLFIEYWLRFGRRRGNQPRENGIISNQTLEKEKYYRKCKALKVR